MSPRDLFAAFFRPRRVAFGLGILLALGALPGQAAVPLGVALSSPTFALFDPGLEKIVDYEKYGRFSNPGTSAYIYYILNREGLSRAVGEGIYPNIVSLQRDPAYQKFLYNRGEDGNVWDTLNSDDYRLNFFRWAASREPPGLKQFYIAQTLERAGLLNQALKAYYATVVHFPKVVGTTNWKMPWYVGPAALDAVAFLTRTYPELGVKLEGGRVRVKNGFDDNFHNDVFEVDPGRLVAVSPSKPSRRPLQDLSSRPVQRRLGQGEVTLLQRDNGHWQLWVKGRPFLVRGMVYSPSPVGKSPDESTLEVHRDWMTSDHNQNGQIDGPQEAWIDKNADNRQDDDEPSVGDFSLLHAMGVNTLRLYHHGFNKTLLRQLYDEFGIRIILGDYMGAYTIGSGADWNAGTDYSDKNQQERMLQSVREMVLDYKDEPYVLFWVLGNENNFGTSNNARQNPQAYYSLINRAAKLIKSLDPKRPVALCNGDLLFLDVAAKLCPDVDIYAANVYRGGHGFGNSFWMDLAEVWKKPVLISEFGCPSYHRRRSPEEAEALQENYLRQNWLDIEYNVAGAPGVGNAIGGVLFEWVDEWWKAGPPPEYDASKQETVGQYGGPFPDGWSYEEWFGIMSQGDGTQSPFLRKPRKAYYLFKDDLWSQKRIAEMRLPK